MRKIIIIFLKVADMQKFILPTHLDSSWHFANQLHMEKMFVKSVSVCANEYVYVAVGVSESGSQNR